jgi:hypothetical protein
VFSTQKIMQNDSFIDIFGDIDVEIQKIAAKVGLWNKVDFVCLFLGILNSDFKVTICNRKEIVSAFQ